MTIGESIQHHQVIYTLGTYYVAASAIGAMPTPSPTGSRFYQWLFGFLQTLGANVSRVVAQKYPQAQVIEQTKIETQVVTKQ